MATIKRKLMILIAICSIAIFYCEFLLYYAVLWQCKYPSAEAQSSTTLRAMILADTHLLGPRNGHWFDKLRREWQMHRSFQTAITYFQPEAVFFLGDLFDEGQWSSDQQFQQYVERFNSLFYVDKTKTKIYVMAGNHDIGFHYVITPYLNKRFKDTFKTKSVKTVVIKGIPFVIINSMAFEGDECFLCRTVATSLKNVGEKLQEACVKRSSKVNVDIDCDNLPKPILLSHFPLYRQSDSHCNQTDSAPPSEKEEKFRESWDCISRDSSQLLLEEVKPRLILSGHTHHGCLTVHNDVPEWTVPSFSWRNKKNPSFLLAKFSQNSVDIEKCHMPDENSLYFIYVFFTTIMILALFKR